MHGLQGREMEQLFLLMTDTLPVGVAVLDLDLRLLFINRRHAELNRVPITEQLGHPIRDYLPQVADIIEPKMRFVLETGIPLVGQEIRGNGPGNEDDKLFRLASYYPRRDDSGNICGILALIQDASIDSVEAQLAEESKQRLLQVLDNLFAFVGVLDMDGTLLECNRAPLEAAGITVDDVRGKKLWDTYWWSHDPELAQQLKEAINRCRNGETVRYDVHAKMINDSRMWVDFMLAPLRDEAGKVTHLIPSGIDISKRHDSEAALHQSEDRYRSVIESSDDAIITKSLEGIITGWNPAAERLLGYSAKEALGKPITMLFPAALLGEEQHLLRRISNGERIPPFDTVRIHKAGHFVDVSITISPLRDRNGKVIGACKLAHDIGSKKRQWAALEQALEEKTALLHEVHHRVKNNLQIVSSLLKLQARQAPEEVARVLGESQSRIRAMALVHQLLYDSEMMSEIELSEFINRLIALTVASHDTTKLGIKLHYSGPDKSIFMSAHRMIPLGLVINELVLNAIKHAFPADWLAERSPLQARIDIRLQEISDDKLHLQVADNGRGLSSEFNWDAAKGLGTQLIPMFVAQLHGELETTSTNAGSCFTIAISPKRKGIA
ncbi:PAS domain-containing protein [Undibacterium sp. Di26W]|uniref:PAS domain-containing protein n=1 Tax=Undibacterium sp. Di26W TaxID=3413035 RepID=UPI003BEF8DB9